MSERVIWERDIDHARIRARTVRFRTMFGVPAVFVLLAMLVFGDVGAAVGLLIVLAVIGLAWGMTVRFQNLSDAANPRLVVDGGRIVLGNRTVTIEDVKRYTTVSSSIRTSVGKLGRMELGRVVFRLDDPRPQRDPELVEFGWPNMAAAQVPSLKEALDPILVGKWVEPQDLFDPDEHSPQRRRRSAP